MLRSNNVLERQQFGLRGNGSPKLNSSLLDAPAKLIFNHTSQKLPDRSVFEKKWVEQTTIIKNRDPINKATHCRVTKIAIK